MSGPNCPTCDARLTGPQLRGGWCESCGTKIPSSVLATGLMVGPAEIPLPRVSLGMLIGGGVLAVLGVLLLSLSLSVEPTDMPGRSRPVKALIDLLGKSGSGVACGLVLIGAGFFLALKQPDE